MEVGAVTGLYGDLGKLLDSASNVRKLANPAEAKKNLETQAGEFYRKYNALLSEGRLTGADMRHFERFYGKVMAYIAKPNQH